MKLRAAALTATALALAAAAPASAADHSITLSAAAVKSEWDGAPQVSHWLPVYDEASREAMPCKVARPCENVHINLTEPGKMTLKVEGLEGTGGTTDVDIFLYKSDASETQGEKIAVGAASGPDSVSVAKAAAGYYLMVVDYYHSYNSGYKGTATLVPAAPAVAPPAPATPATPAAPATPASPSQPSAAEKKKAAAKKRRAACTKKAKKIKNKRKRAKALKRCKKIK